MVGAKVSIVTHKVQTTRARIRGVALEGDAQIVFVDTPGLFRPRRRLDRAMVAAAWGGAADADVVVLLIEAHRGVTPGVEKILEGLADIGKGRIVALAINKIDRVKAEVLLALTKAMNERYPFAETFMISAEKGHGVDDLRKWLAERMPEGPWLYPEDQIADLPLRMIAAEITREKLTLRLHQELPYQLTVETENWEERPDGSARIDQLIYVMRDGHKRHRAGQEGRDDQGGEPGGARGTRGVSRPQGAPVPAGQGPAELARRGRALLGDGARLQGRQHVTRLASGIWVGAYLARLQAVGIPVYVIARGDETAGAVLVKLATLDGAAQALHRVLDLTTAARGAGTCWPRGRSPRSTRRSPGSGGSTRTFGSSRWKTRRDGTCSTSPASATDRRKRGLRPAVSAPDKPLANGDSRDGYPNSHRIGGVTSVRERSAWLTRNR